MSKKLTLFFTALFFTIGFSLYGNESIRVLAIGNSFSEDAVEQYLYELGQADQVDFTIGNMYIGGCSLETHWSNAANDLGAYSYRKISTGGIKTTTDNFKLSQAIADESWDYIVFQQVSQNSGMYETFFPYLTNLLTYTKSIATNPNVKYAMHLTWAYAQSSDHSGFVNYNNSQSQMYNAIVNAVFSAANTENIQIVIPAGTAIQNGRTSFIGDNFCRDGYHLDLGVGRYTAACTWFEKLSGKSVVGNTYSPSSLTAKRVSVAQNAAHFAVQNPQTVTNMAAGFSLPDPATFSLSAPINIDFGSTLSSIPWNNISSVSQGTSISALLDSKSKETPFNIEITSPFGNINLNGPANGITLQDWEMPKEVSSDSFWGNAGTAFEGKNIVTASLKVSNLNPSKRYNFKMFASRAATDNRETSFKVTGKYSQTAYVNSSSNIAELAVVNNVVPKPDGTIEITLGAGPNNNNANKFFYINSLQISQSKESSLDQSFYFDFGPNDVTNGNITPSPDANGNYWNNPTSKTVGSTLDGLKNSVNITSSYGFEVTKLFNTNGINHGGLRNPDPQKLADFAIDNATQDYFFLEGAAGVTSGFKIKNLNVDKAYQFHVFGSRSGTDTRIAKYTFTGASQTTGTLQTTGPNLGGTGINQNNSNIYISELIFPDTNGEINFEIARLTGNFAHINVMKMEERTLQGEKVSSLSISGDNILNSGQTSQINAVILPENAIYPNINWSVSDESVAWIDGNGKIFPKKNGNVTVTATIKYSEDEIFTANCNISISNQLSQIYISGTATESGDILQNASEMRMITDAKGTITNKYEIYTSLSAGAFKFYTSIDQNAVEYGAGTSTNSIVAGGNPINTTVTGPVKITVDLTNNSYNILSLANLSIVGSALPGGWNPASSLNLTYTGNGVWSDRVTLKAGTSSDRARFVIILDKSWNYQMKKVKGTENGLILQSQADQYSITSEDIYTNLNGGVFDITINLHNFTYSIDCVEMNDLKISIMGSSVANGQGATNMHGYAYMYGQLLQQRYAANNSANWQTSNVSINGNNTFDLLGRFNADLINDCGKYVIYGLSLGNEGIHEKGQEAFDSYKTNMFTLIDKAKSAGKIPVVCNNYTRGDFNTTDYNFVKQMNLLMHEWSVPTINMLGAIDDGIGKWATGYQVTGDIYHPTTEGHQEFFYAIVPSLFDALASNKTAPSIKAGTSYQLGKSVSDKSIEFTPENIVHPFTLSFDFKTSQNGTIATFENSTGTGNIIVNESGTLTYFSPNGGNITSSVTVSNDNWYKTTLTHYFAQGKTILYINNVKIGELNEKLEPNKFNLSNANAPSVIDFRQLFFWRSGMNQDEINALNSGKMLQSSLEIYAPLDKGKVVLSNELENLAQSTNTLKLVTNIPTKVSRTANFPVTLYPNPTKNVVNILGLEQNQSYEYTVFKVDGKSVLQNTMDAGVNSLDLNDLQPAYYILLLNEINHKSEPIRLSFIKSEN